MSERIYFGTNKDAVQIPDLNDLQARSYGDFLQKDVHPNARANAGLQAVFREAFPIRNHNGTIELDFVSYEIEDPKITSLDSLRKCESFSASLYVTFTLKDETGTKAERLYMGELPMLSNRGTFIINGIERVIVPQLSRSPGIYFDATKDLYGNHLHSFQIVPGRGTIIMAQFDSDDILYIYLNDSRRFLATTFLRVLGYPTDRDIVSHCYSPEILKLSPAMDEAELGHKVLHQDIRDGEMIVAKAYEPLTIGTIRLLLALGHNTVEVLDARENEILLKSLRKDPAKDEESALKDIYRTLRPGDPPTASNSRALLRRLFFDPKQYDLTRVGRYKINQKLGISVNSDQRNLVPEDILAAVRYILNLKKGVGDIDDIDHLSSRRVRSVGELLANQCRLALVDTERLVKERMSLFDVNFEGMTPQKLLNPKALSDAISNLFIRGQFSESIRQENPLAEVVHKGKLSALGQGLGEIDFVSSNMPARRVRGLHPSHYGRICPLQTPKGNNIGLINSMCIFARVNHLGFIETPYRKIINGRVGNEIEYLSAEQEEEQLIAHANNPIDSNNYFINQRISVRAKGGCCHDVDVAQVNYMDVSTSQSMSASAAMIPFLEYVDPDLAMDGVNVMRQALPLLVSEAPLIGTGLEGQVARDSRAVVVAESDGIVAAVTAEFIAVITSDGNLPVSYETLLSDPESVNSDTDKGIVVYLLRKFMCSNAGTCINQKPIVKKSQLVKKGQVLADGPSTDGGELAIGRNVLVALMPWRGHNLKGSIVISDRLLKEDIFTSIQLQELDVAIRNTARGPEKITLYIPDVDGGALRNLDNDGIIRVGSEVKPGDILVGKVTPNFETDISPEESLVLSVLGGKYDDAKNSSLLAPVGFYGIVHDVLISYGDVRGQGFQRKRQEVIGHDDYEDQMTSEEIDILTEDLIDELADHLSIFLLDEKIPLDVVNTQTGEIIIPANLKITKMLLRKLASVHDHIEIGPSPIRNKIVGIVRSYERRFLELETERERINVSSKSIAALDTRVITQVRIIIAFKRKIAVGDKLTNRQGNTGVVATILPEEDMPYLPDGTTIDVCLNPLAIASKMNVGQLLEAHLGVAAKALGFKVATPIFDSIKEDDIWDFMSNAKQVDGANLVGRNGKLLQRRPDEPKGLGFTWIGDGKDGTSAGKSILYDGQTGVPFESPVTVGIIYLLKLGPLVADKINARAVGPYSLFTHQPIGDRLHYEGQPFGEMEVWALEAYGAAYTLQEMVTVKSDDVQGRTRIYEGIVKGDSNLEVGTPESFNVLIKEMQSLGLDVRPGRKGSTKGSDMIGGLDDFSLDDLYL